MFDFFEKALEQGFVDSVVSLAGGLGGVGSSPCQEK